MVPSIMPDSGLHSLPDWRLDPVFADIQNSPSASDWLKALTLSGCTRDPVDVIHDLRFALTSFEAAFDRAYSHMTKQD